MRAEAALKEFALERGLEVSERVELRELTPALITGRHGAVPWLVEGELIEGLNGQLCHHVYADTQAKHLSTAVITAVPEITAYIPALVCRDRRASRGRDVAQLPSERWAAVEVESEAFNQRYRLLTLAGQDSGFIRELFSPALIAWLSERAPDGLSFELNQAHLVVTVVGHVTDPEKLGELCRAAAQLSTRIRTEALEEEADPDLFNERPELADLDRALGEIRWERPPETVQEAIALARGVAGRKPRALVVALWLALSVGAVIAVLTALVLTPIAGAVAGCILAVLLFPAARFVAATRYRWGTVSVARVGLEGFVREYAKSRGLDLVDRWRFHSEFRELPLPGFADHVLEGPIPHSGVNGLFVMLGDAPELRSRGEEMAFISDRPLAASALVMELERPVEARAVEGVGLPEEYSVEISGRRFVVWRPVQGNLLRTAAGSDRFRARAADVVRDVIAGSGPA